MPGSRTSRIGTVGVTDVATEPAPVPARGGNWVAALAAVLLLLVVGGAAYLRVGWWRMESACSLDSDHGPVAGSVSYGWGWQPPGFRCTYDSGVTTTSLWF